MGAEVWNGKGYVDRKEERERERERERKERKREKEIEREEEKIEFLKATHFLSTLISFSRLSSFPLSAFLSIHFTATICPGSALHSARNT